MTGYGKIRFVVDPSIADLIPRYLSGRRNDIPAIVELLERREFAEVQRYGHRMAGSGKAFGFAEISSIGRAIERAALHNNAARVTQAVERLQRYLASLELVFPGAR